jgi:hypothetical protein
LLANVSRRGIFAPIELLKIVAALSADASSAVATQVKKGRGREKGRNNAAGALIAFIALIRWFASFFCVF